MPVVLSEAYQKNQSESFPVFHSAGNFYTSRGHERDVLELLELERHQRDQLSGMSG
jgi:hypothetical protein